jgi:hypothetical protein
MSPTPWSAILAGTLLSVGVPLLTVIFWANAKSGTLRALFVPLVIGVSFILSAVIAIQLPWDAWFDVPRDALGPGDVISLFNGAATAAALAAVYLQVRQGQEQAKDASRKAEREAILLADQLHAAYVTRDMLESRLRALECLQRIEGDAPLRKRFIDYWVLNEIREPPSEFQTRDENGRAIDLTDALSIILSFYVRLERYLELHREVLDPEQRAELGARLAWTLWAERGLAQFAKDCGTRFEQAKQRRERATKPYFVDSLARLGSLTCSTPWASSPSS